MTTQATAVVDVHTIGLGAGPGNLSLAALFEGAAPDRIALFDAAPGPTWHPQLMLPGVRLQTSWLKDLASVVAPQHRLTFLNYLVTTGRLFGLLNAQFAVIPRMEYDRYLAWASAELGNVHYGVRVDRVSFDHGFEVYSADRLVGRSQHLVVGLGSEPYVPEGFADVLGDAVFVPERLAERLQPMSADLDAPVAVVGGGQTGAECVLALLGGGFRNILWFGRRRWFQPIDDSPPANEHYRPAYLEYLQQVSVENRRRLVDGATRTGDAITPGVLQSIYQTNYDRMLVHGSFPLTMLPDRSVTSAEACDGGYELQVQAALGAERHQVRHIVLATGRRTRPLPFDDELRERLELDDNAEVMLDADFSVRWKGTNGHRLFAPYLSRFSHGIAATNLTLLPVRAAIVLNSLFDREQVRFSDDLLSTSWG